MKMEEQLKVEVKVISRETIKPSSPTLPHSKSFNLSFLDQAFPCWHSSFALVYSSSSNNNNNKIISSLKASLSETLTVFYPLAGRFENESTISCNDQGALFIETQFNCLLPTILTTPDHDVLSTLEKCLPPLDVQGFCHPITEVIPLAFQVNVFTCGSIVIGCYMIHKLLDATSISSFLNYWAALSKTKYISANNIEMLVVKQRQPDFESTIAAFPPAPRDIFSNNSTTTSTKTDIDHNTLPKIVGKSFVFNKVGIEKLKVKVSSEELPNPTGFEAVTAFTWQCAFAAATSSKKIDSSMLVFPANIRPRTCPSLPKEAMGCLITKVFTTSHQANIDELPQLATTINAAKVAKVDQKVELLQRLGAEAMLLETPKSFVLEMGTYHVTSWCKLGLSDVNFGFGKLDRIIPLVLVIPFLKNRICLVDYVEMTTTHSHSEIEAWFFLEEKEMKLLRSDSCFLEFACPT